MLGAAVALLALAGCGGGGSTTTVTKEQTVTKTTSTTEGGGGGEEAGGGGAGSEAPAEFLELESFQSPTGNIGCILIEGDARCDVVQHSWAAPRPKDCPPQMDAGQGLQVGASGRASVVCAGDTALNNSAPVLEYGTASEGGGTLCVSRKAGITCTNADGHGFTVSAQSYKLF